MTRLNGLTRVPGDPWFRPARVSKIIEGELIQYKN
jgi:hypothetical protein